MAYRLAPQAEADLEELAFYVFADSGSLEAADRIVASITARFDLLAQQPRAGRRRDDLRHGLRSFPVHDFLILHRLEGDDVVILRVVRGSRELESLLRE